MAEDAELQSRRWQAEQKLASLGMGSSGGGTALTGAELPGSVGPPALASSGNFPASPDLRLLIATGG